MGSLRYPPCVVNPLTEKPYPRHKWEIPAKAHVIVKNSKDGPVYFYRVRCARCGFNDPHPPSH